jgi:hypothetical protein
MLFLGTVNIFILLEDPKDKLALASIISSKSMFQYIFLIFVHFPPQNNEIACTITYNYSNGIGYIAKFVCLSSTWY